MAHASPLAHLALALLGSLALTWTSTRYLPFYSPSTSRFISTCSAATGLAAVGLALPHVNAGLSSAISASLNPGWTFPLIVLGGSLLLGFLCIWWLTAWLYTRLLRALERFMAPTPTNSAATVGCLPVGLCRPTRGGRDQTHPATESLASPTSFAAVTSIMISSRHSSR